RYPPCLVLSIRRWPGVYLSHGGRWAGPIAAPAGESCRSGAGPGATRLELPEVTGGATCPGRSQRGPARAAYIRLGAGWRMPRERFVFEPIEVDVATIPAAALGRGAPACPGRFRWRGE